MKNRVHLAALILLTLGVTGGGGAGGGAAQAQTFSNAQADQQCARDWRGDPTMITFCQNQQGQSIASLRRNQPHVQGTALEASLRQCNRDWAPDYVMVDFCLNENWGAYDRIRGQLTTSKGRTCQRDWGSDYVMVEFCLEN